MRWLTGRLWLARLAGVPDLAARQAELERRTREDVERLTGRLHAAAAAQALTLVWIDREGRAADHRTWLLQQPTYAGRIALAPPTWLPAEMILGTTGTQVYALPSEEEALRWWALGGGHIYRVRLEVIEQLDGVRWKERIA